MTSQRGQLCQQPLYIRLNPIKALITGQLTGRRGISNQMGSRRLHVENDLSARPWKNGEEGYSRKDPCDKRLKGEPCQNVVVKLDVEGKAKAKGGRQNWESFLKKKAGAQVLNSIPVNVSSYLRILFVFFFLGLEFIFYLWELYNMKTSLYFTVFAKLGILNQI